MGVDTPISRRHIEYFQIDLGIAMEHMVLKAADLGLGTCWIGWFKEDRIKEILDIPKKIKVSALLAVGYPADEPTSRTGRKPMEKILFHEKWGRPEDKEGSRGLGFKGSSDRKKDTV